MHGLSIASLPVAVAVVAVLLSVATRAGAADPTAFAVNSTVDAVDASPGDGICATAWSQCTLRAAIQEANALPGPDVIVLPSGTYTLTVAGGQVASGGLDISDDLEIRGAGAATTVIDANHLGRVLQVLSGTSIVSSVALKGAGPFSFGCGPGGVFNQGNLTLNDAIISENSGAGIFNVGTLTVNRSTISSNGRCTQGGLGGGLVSFGTATLTNVTVSGNADIGGGGAIRVGPGSATLVNVTVSDNFGGGIFAGGPVTLRNTIVANNSGGNCGGKSPLTDTTWKTATCVASPRRATLSIQIPNLGPSPTTAVLPRRTRFWRAARRSTRGALIAHHPRPTSVASPDQSTAMVMDGLSAIWAPTSSSRRSPPLHPPPRLYPLPRLRRQPPECR